MSSEPRHAAPRRFYDADVSLRERFRQDAKSPIAALLLLLGAGASALRGSWFASASMAALLFGLILVWLATTNSHPRARRESEVLRRLRDTDRN